MRLGASSRPPVAGRGTSSTWGMGCFLILRSSISSIWWSSSMPHRHTAVLLMAYGSPNRLDEVEPYFTDIRGGRKPPAEAVAELKGKYRRGGGAPPPPGLPRGAGG